MKYLKLLLLVLVAAQTTSCSGYGNSRCKKIKGIAEQVQLPKKIELHETASNKEIEWYAYDEELKLPKTDKEASIVVNRLGKTEPGPTFAVRESDIREQGIPEDYWGQLFFLIEGISEGKFTEVSCGDNKYYTLLLASVGTEVFNTYSTGNLYWSKEREYFFYAFDYPKAFSDAILLMLSINDSIYIVEVKSNDKDLNHLVVEGVLSLNKQ